jgi:hypothetical protein
LPKTSGKKKLSEKISILSTKQIELQHVLLHMSMRLKKKGKIQIDKRDEKIMADEAEKQNKKYDRESSEDDGEEDYEEEEED